MKNLLILLSLITILSGCASQKSLLVTPETQLKPESGIILASVTKNGGTDAWFYYQKDGAEEEQRMDAVGMVMFKEPDDFPEDEDRTGRLLALEAPQGSYFLTRWQLYVYMGTGYKYIGPKESKPLPFKVKAGEITYLGNLHVNTIFGKNVFGISIPAAGISSIVNRDEVDLELLKEKYPFIADWPVNVEIPDRSEWKI